MGAFVAVLGFYPWVAGYLWGLIGPPWYEIKYRTKHQNKEISIGFAPSITSSADHRRFDVGIELAVRYAIE
jgi:hypothetical protein